MGGFRLGLVSGCVSDDELTRRLHVKTELTLPPPYLAPTTTHHPTAHLLSSPSSSPPAANPAVMKSDHATQGRSALVALQACAQEPSTHASKKTWISKVARHVCVIAHALSRVSAPFRASLAECSKLTYRLHLSQSSPGDRFHREVQAACRPYRGIQHDVRGHLAHAVLSRLHQESSLWVGQGERGLIEINRYVQRVSPISSVKTGGTA